MPNLFILNIPSESQISINNNPARFTTPLFTGFSNLPPQTLTMISLTLDSLCTLSFLFYSTTDDTILVYKDEEFKETNLDPYRYTSGLGEYTISKSWLDLTSFISPEVLNSIIPAGSTLNSTSTISSYSKSQGLEGPEINLESIDFTIPRDSITEYALNKSYLFKKIFKNDEQFLGLVSISYLLTLGGLYDGYIHYTNLLKVAYSAFDFIETRTDFYIKLTLLVTDQFRGLDDMDQDLCTAIFGFQESCRGKLEVVIDKLINVCTDRFGWVQDVDYVVVEDDKY